MRKYKIIKGLVLFIALFAVVCFFTPFAYGAFNSGISLGFDFIIGTSENGTVLLGIWITRLSAVLAVAAVVFAVLPLVIKDTNGFNKQGKIHKSLFISIALSLSSALLNFISMLIGACSVVYESGPWGNRSYSVYDEFYTYIGLVCVVVLLIPVIVLCVKLKSDNAKIKAAPQVKNTVDNMIANPAVTQPKPAAEKSVISSATTTMQSELTIEKTVVEPYTDTGVYQTEKQTPIASDSKKSKSNNKLLEKLLNYVKGIFKTVKGIFNGMSRSKSGIYGDLEGPMTNLESGKMVISIEDEKLIAWTVGRKDVELSTDTVEDILLFGRECVTDGACNGTKKIMSFYFIEMKNGQMGTLRLFKDTEDKALQILGVVSKKGPIGKPIEWFSSEAGLESYAMYVSQQNFMSEDKYVEGFHKEQPDYDLWALLNVIHYGDMIPNTYFMALACAINVQPMNIQGPNSAVVMFLKDMAKPYTVNEDGEPEARTTDLTPEQIVSVEKNPLLYFVKHFNVFEIADDSLGTAKDKITLYLDILTYIATVITVTKDFNINEHQWLFNKDTYLNDFGMIKKEKGFLKKCREVSGIPEYFDAALSKLEEDN